MPNTTANPAVPPSTGLADILDRAADDIARHGLHRGDFYDVDRAMSVGTAACPKDPRGAINTAAGLDPDDCDQASPAYAATAVLAESLGIARDGTSDGLILGLAIWSDDPGRSADEIERALRACAADLRTAAAA